LALLALCGWAAPAAAIHENDIAFAPHFGVAAFLGQPGKFAAPNFGYGLGIGYGTSNWLGVEADVVYSQSGQVKYGNTGGITFSHLSGGLGPRFNWNGRYVVPWAAVEAAGSFMEFKSDWFNGSAEHHTNETAHAFGGLGFVGLDFPIHDEFTIGLAGFASAQYGSLVFSDKAVINGKIGVYGSCGALIRLTLIF
jgi:hypothetical protein